MKLLKYVKLAVMVTFCCLLSTSSIFAADEKNSEEEALPLRQRHDRVSAAMEFERQEQRLHAQANPTNPCLLLRCPDPILSEIATYLGSNVRRWISYIICCKTIHKCTKNTQIPLKFELSKENYKNHNMFKNLQKFSAIHLTVSYANNVTFRQIATLTKLLSLYLDNTMNVTDEGLQHLYPLTGLLSLTLDCVTEVEDASFQRLTELINLKSLYLGSTKTSDLGLKYIGSMHNLQEVTLDDLLKVTDAGLLHLSTLRNLRELTLNKLRKLTDGGLNHLNTLPMLENFCLRGIPKITSVGLIGLISLPHFKTLTLDEMGDIDEGVTNLMTLMPKLVINYIF